jgi:subtilisin family serine protease
MGISLVMKRGTIFILLGILLLSFFVAKLDTSKLTERASMSISGSVVEELEDQDNVRVMIKLKSEVKKGKSIASKEVKKEVADILEDKIKHEFDDKVSAFISKEELEELKNSSNIESIELVGTRSIILQDSVPLTNVSAVHPLQIDGINLTGEGETICIIDTGIDYNHTDFGNCYGNNDPDSDCKILGGMDYCADDTTCTSSDDYPNDNHGHGSHVAGIAAADGGLVGVAPGANLIIIKAANSSGTFWDDDLEKAINWCVDNASTFNIGVISMSLGGGLFSDYCNSDPLADEINNAIANDISVIVATGNEGSTSQIEGPACVQNATPVGGSDKSDGMYSNGNRNSLVMLLAPGVNINSTIPSSSYATLSGTSMATPHVSGAFALVRQYLRLEKSGTVYTPEEIENVLNDTGKVIDDSGGSGLKYSRIDLYGAIYSLDDIAPNVTLLSPADNSYTETENASFSCSASDTLGLTNMTFYLWNSSNDLINETTYDFTGNYSSTIEINISNLNNGSYTWNCKALDIKDNSAFASENFTKTVGKIEIELVSPADNTYTKTAAVNFTCAANDTIADLSNMTFYLWNSSGSLVYSKVKNISGNSNETAFNYSFTNEAGYDWNCHAIDEESNEIYENNNSITYDATAPTIVHESPEDNNETTETEIDFEYNASDDNEIVNCSLIIDGDINDTDTTIQEGEINTFSNVDLPEGNYDWKITCTDIAGNTATTTKWDLEINSGSEDEEEDDEDEEDSSTTGGSTGGVPTGARTYVLTDASVQQGTSKLLNKDDQMRFKVKNIYHSVKVLSISTAEVKVSVSSDPFNVTIKLNETKKVNVDDDDKTYDLEITFSSLTNGSANITVKTISEAIGTRQISDNETSNETTTVTGEGIEEPEKQPMDQRTKIIIIVSVICGAALIGIILFSYKKRDLILSKLSGIKNKK